MQKQEEENELQLLIKNKETHQLQLKNPNQHLPSQQLRANHQYQHTKYELTKTKLQLSAALVGICIAGFSAVWYWISIAYPTQEISAYASVMGGDFPKSFGIQIFAIIFFLLLTTLLLGVVYPDVARKVKEEYNKKEKKF